MSTQINTFKTLEGIVQFSNMDYDPKTRKMDLTVGIKKPNQRKFREQNLKNVIVTKELHEWFVVMTDDTIKVKADNERGFEYVKTGSKSTRFQKYLRKLDIEFQPGILKRLKITSSNTSDKYLENPFRLAMLRDNNILTLVNVPSKKRTEHVDLETGEITPSYKQKVGQLSSGTHVKAFIRPEKYRRLVVATIKEVEVYQES